MSLRPSRAVAGIGHYQVPRHPAPIELRLDGNEGMRPADDVFHPLRDASPALLRRYPSRVALQERLAARLNVPLDQLITTCGGDDALDRAFRCMLEPGREVVIPTPTFDMLHRYARWTGATVVEVPWGDTPWPRQAVLDALTPETAVVCVVTPNNPTGGIATAEDLRAISAAAPQALLVVDLAYTEFAAVDLTATALALPNAVVFRTLSKAYGLAGLRVGYAAGPAEVIGWMRSAGNPYTVSAPSVALACAALDGPQEEADAFVARIKAERITLAATLRELGAETWASEGNFVYAKIADPLWLRDALAGIGIGIRVWPGTPGREHATRITCAGYPDDAARLEHGLRSALAPEALILDMDGVLADVSDSYRTAVRATTEAFGVTLEPEAIRDAKDAGGANNDWLLTRKLLADRGVEVSLEAVTATFEALYQGTDTTPGLKDRETCLVSLEQFAEWGRRYPIAIVTGRPMVDAMYFLDLHGLTPHVKTVVSMDDAPAKPDPAPVRLALERLGVTTAWMVGDTPDDIRASRAAGVVPLGVVAPGDDFDHVHAVLTPLGAARVLRHTIDLQELLP